MKTIKDQSLSSPTTNELLITDLRCALPVDAWTDADSNVTKPMSTPSVGKWRIIDYRSTAFSGMCRWDNDECMAGARLDDPEVQRVWHNYWPPQDNPLLAIGGICVDGASPATAFE